MNNFKAPHTLKMNEEKGYQEVEQSTSEEFRLLEALGTPRVFYAVKANKYYKDAECTKLFTDEEINALELPIPAKIENERRKLIKAANETGTAVDFKAVYAATSPTEVLPPKTIRDRLVTVDPVDRMINRINRSTIGK
jgi:hypothetical protein